MNEYRNIENLKKWLEENLKMPHGCYSINAVIDEIEEQYGNTANPSYELKSHETNSGHPETYRYEVETRYNEESDSYDMIYIF